MNSLMTELLDAQRSGDKFSEAVVIKAIANEILPPHRGNQNDGRTLAQRFYSKVAFGFSDCWYWCGHVDDIGYGRFAFPGENKAHRASWAMHNGDIPVGMKVLHRCDVRSCVNPEHLFLGTQADNIHDMISKGRQNFPSQAFGEKNPMSKLTWNTVQEIRRRYAEESLSMAQLAKIYGVAPMTIQRAVKGTTWNRK